MVHISGYSPPHQCKPLSGDLYSYGVTEKKNATFQLVASEKCQTIYAINVTNTTSYVNVPCLEGYDYDIQEATFVTEVSNYSILNMTCCVLLHLGGWDPLFFRKWWISVGDVPWKIRTCHLIFHCFFIQFDSNVRPTT